MQTLLKGELTIRRQETAYKNNPKEQGAADDGQILEEERK